MTTIENPLETDIQAGFNGTQGAEGTQEQPTPGADQDNAALIEASNRAAVAEAKLQWEADAKNEAQSKPEPEKDILGDAIKALPEDERESAEKLKPVLESIINSQKGDSMTKAEVQELLAKGVEDNKNIANLTIWQDKMAKEWDGENGKPKFEWEKLNEFMQEKGYKDPMDAFYLMHKTDLIRYAASTAKQPPKPLDGGGNRIPPKGYEPPKNKEEARERMIARATQRAEQAGL